MIKKVGGEQIKGMRESYVLAWSKQRRGWDSSPGGRGQAGAKSEQTRRIYKEDDGKISPHCQ